MKTTLTLFAVTGALVYGALALATPPKPVDNRPQAGTIQCRDAQIDRVQSMVVHVQTDPFKRDYSTANRDVADILRAAETLQALCK